MKFSNITPLTNLQAVKGGACGLFSFGSCTPPRSYSSCGSTPSAGYPTAPKPSCPPSTVCAPVAPVCAPKPVSYCAPRPTFSFGFCGW